MKNLRQLIRRYRNQSSSKRVRRTDSQTRRLNTETLERRELLAADALGISELASHNSWNQFDVNNDREISARDALGVINYLGRGESEQALGSGDRMFYDVNGDNEITAVDALGVINAIGRGEGMETALIELLLTARTYNGDPGGETDGFDLDVIGPESTLSTDIIGQTIRTVPDANQPIEVNVNEVFELEVSYEDLRSFPNRLGAFQLITDIVASQEGYLQPVLFETQQLVVDQALRDVPVDDRDGTSVTLSIPNSPAGRTGDLTYTASWAQFSSNAPVQVRTAMATFGYLSTDYELTIPEGVSPDDIAFQIHWTDIAFADVDLPDISIEVNEVVGAADIPATEVSFDPTVMVGGQEQFNPDAIPFNLNTESRSFDDNEPFYTANNDGGFDPATGFTAVKGIGGVPSQGGGIPQLLNELEYPAGPFDAFSLPVKIVQPVTGLQISVQPNADDGEQTEAILIYGEDDQVPINSDTVVIEGPTDVDMDLNGKATIIINAIDPNGGGSDPVVSQDIAQSFTEDQATQNINLLQFASDPDNDTLTVNANPTITSDPQSAASVSGSTLTIDPSAYGALNDGQQNVISVAYVVNDGNGGTVNSTALITITGVTDVVPNQNPEVSQDIAQSFTEDQATQTIDLLQFASDPDNDTLTVNANPTITSDPQSAASVSGSTLTIDPSAYGALNDGQQNVISVAYVVNDGNGGTVNSTALITITGVTDVVPNQNPEVSQDIAQSFTEDQATQTIDLLQFASDPDNDTLTVNANPTITSDPQSAASVSGSTLTIDPSAYGALNDGQQNVISVAYVVNDGNGGTVNSTALITITGVTDVVPNQNPEVSQDIAQSFTEDQATQTIDLLQFASDPDNDTLTVNANPTITSDPQSAASVSGSTLTINPAAYGALDDGQQNVISVAYVVDDGNGGTVNSTALITITGITDFVNTPPTATATTQSFTEGAAGGTVDLLANASDVDGHTLSVTGLTLASGNAVGITEGTNTLSVDPSDYSSLLPGQSEVIVYSYNVVDGFGGSVATTATITINGAVDDAPMTGTVAAVTTPTNSGAIMIDVLSVANPGGGETQTLSIVTASLANPAAGTLTINGTLSFTPATDFEGDTTINYQISDGTSTDDGTVALSVVNFVPSTIGGSIFIDRIENMIDVIDGAAPFRDGMKDTNEQGLGGVPIKLMGNDMEFSAFTDTNGMYEFTGVAPGTYDVMYHKPDNVIYDGQLDNGYVTMSITIGAAGGVTNGNLNVPLLGLTPGATNAIDILARPYLKSVAIAEMSSNGREGAIVSFDDKGQSNFIMVGEGFDGVRFADVRTVDGSDTDVALLTVLTEGGDVLSTMVARDRAVASPDGSTARFFGGMDDFTFKQNGQSVTSYEDFQSAIDQILSENE